MEKATLQITHEALLLLHSGSFYDSTSSIEQTVVVYKHSYTTVSVQQRKLNRIIWSFTRFTRTRITEVWLQNLITRTSTY